MLGLRRCSWQSLSLVVLDSAMIVICCGLNVDVELLFVDCFRTFFLKRKVNVN